MLRRGGLHWLALGLVLIGAAPPAAVLAPNFASLSLECDANPAIERRLAGSIPYFVGCRYDAVRDRLPPFTTVDWRPSNTAPLGYIVAQSAPPGTPAARLRREFTVTVSAGPAIGVRGAAAIEGETLAFQLTGRPQVPADSPYALEYALSRDPERTEPAVESRDYRGVADRAFARGGVLEVTTLEAGGPEQLYLSVLLRYPSDRAGAAAVLARGEGRIVRKPTVSLFDAVAAEGDELRFLAVIDRRGVVDGTLRYAISIDPGDAVAGRDFDLPGEPALSFEPGVTAKYFAIPTLANDASLDDRQLFLSIGAAGQPVVRARGTILNRTPVPADPAGESGTADRSDRDIFSAVGLDWLAAIGAAAIGIAAGFGFGARRAKPSAPDPAPGAAPEPEAGPHAQPLRAPVVGWTVATPDPPAVKGGSLAPDGPSIAIDLSFEPGEAARPDSLPIAAETTSDE